MERIFCRLIFRPSYKDLLFLEEVCKIKVRIEVYDLVGRTIKHIESSDGQAIEFGEELPSGEYLTLVKQGENMKAVNLVKK